MFKSHHSGDTLHTQYGTFDYQIQKWKKKKNPDFRD